MAYVVCQHYGINTSDYSFSYVAGWSEGKETPELKSSLDKIRQTAADFIYQIDQKLEVLQADREQTKEQIAEISRSTTDNEVDRKEERVKLIKKSTEQLSAETKKPKQISVKSKLKEGKKKVEKMPRKEVKVKESII